MSTEGWLSATSSNPLDKHTLHNYFFKALNNEGSCYGLNVCAPQNSHVEALTLNVAEFEAVALDW